MSWPTFPMNESTFALTFRWEAGDMTNDEFRAALVAAGWAVDHAEALTLTLLAARASVLFPNGDQSLFRNEARRLMGGPK